MSTFSDADVHERIKEIHEYFDDNASRHFVSRGQEGSYIGPKGDELGSRWLTLCADLENQGRLSPSQPDPSILVIWEHAGRQGDEDGSANLVDFDIRSDGERGKTDDISWYCISLDGGQTSENAESRDQHPRGADVFGEDEGDDRRDFERAPTEIPASVSVYSNIHEGLLSVLPNQEGSSREVWIQSLLKKFTELAKNKGGAVHPLSERKLETPESSRPAYDLVRD